jgi:hypothetical protein
MAGEAKDKCERKNRGENKSGRLVFDCHKIYCETTINARRSSARKIAGQK